MIDMMTVKMSRSLDVQRMVGADRFEAVLAAAQRLDLRRIWCANLRRD